MAYDDIFSVRTSDEACQPALTHRVLGKHCPNASKLANVTEKREERDSFEPIQVVHHTDIRDRHPKGQVVAGVALQDVDEKTSNGCTAGHE